MRGKLFYKLRILPCSQSVTDTLRAQIQGSPNGFGAGTFSGMRGQAKTVFLGVSVGTAKQIRRTFFLVASNANADNISITVANCIFKSCSCRFRPKLAHRIENPQQRNSKVALATFTASLQSFEDGVEIQFAPYAHTHRDVNFGVEDSL